MNTLFIDGYIISNTADIEEGNQALSDLLEESD